MADENSCQLSGVIEQTTLNLLEHIHHALGYHSFLQESGWSPDDTALAVELNYPLHPHVVRPQHAYDSKYGCGPAYLYRWIVYHYKRSHAKICGVQIEEFVEEWRTLTHFTYEHVGYSYDTYERSKTVFDALPHFYRGRRFNLSREEILGELSARFDSFPSYLWFRRRGLKQPDARRIVEAVISRPWQLYQNRKFVVEAYRRGATVPLITAYVIDERIEELAHQLRQANR